MKLLKTIKCFGCGQIAITRAKFTTCKSHKQKANSPNKPFWSCEVYRGSSFEAPFAHLGELNFFHCLRGQWRIRLCCRLSIILHQKWIFFNTKKLAQLSTPFIGFDQRSVNPNPSHRIHSMDQKKAFLRKKLNRPLKERVDEECESPWGNPVVPIPKPNGTYRLCVDYRYLNSATIADSYRMTRIDNILQTAKKNAQTQHLVSKRNRRRPKRKPYPAISLRRGAKGNTTRTVDFGIVLRKSTVNEEGTIRE